jgi:hypothetical protein
MNPLLTLAALWLSVEVFRTLVVMWEGEALDEFIKESKNK